MFRLIKSSSGKAKNHGVFYNVATRIWDPRWFTMCVAIFSIYIYRSISNILCTCGPGSSFGIEIDQGLDGPRSNPGGDEIFRPSRPALGPTQPSVQCVPGFSPGGKVRPGRAADHSPSSSAAIMEEQSYTSTHPLGHTGPVTGSLYLYYAPMFRIRGSKHVMCWCVGLGSGSLIRFLVTPFVVVVLVAGSFCIKISSAGGWVQIK